MTSNLTPKEIVELKEKFDSVDKNKDGKISPDEMEAVLNAVGIFPSDAELRLLMSEADINGNGFIEFDEYIKMMSEKMDQKKLENELREAFKEYDKDGDGKITKSELKAVILKSCDKDVLTEEDVDMMLGRTEADSEGRVGFEEFVLLLAVMTALKEVFMEFDKNKDGKITTDELGLAMQARGMNPTFSEVQDLMKEADLNGSGAIEFPEFVVTVGRKLQQKQSGPSEEDLKKAFAALDKDGDGFITVDELKYIMTNAGEPLSDKEAEEMLKEADIDGDGKINYEEFVKVISRS